MCDMGVTFSCPFANIDDLDARFESYLVRHINFEGEYARTALRSLSFNGRDSESAMKKSLGSGKMIVEGSLSFNGRGLETKISLMAPPVASENRTMTRSETSKTKVVVPDKSPLAGSMSEKTSPMLLPGCSQNRDLAAVKLQKTYKSFRTRRQLADCAVLAEQRWWKVLDFAELKRTSVSFFDIEKPETAVSRWSRAKSRAAKVGKGLSKAEKARKLALQHWLEAIDPRHRYGHNLQFYYVKWLQCESRQPFFYWLDIGEGKEVNLEKCSRSKLQQQCIKYLGPIERKAYEVSIDDGKFLYKQSGQLLDTRGGPEDAKWIFVLSVSKVLYVGMKNKGTFQHSSFLAGGATLSAGRLIVENGILKAVWPHSGHYLPTEENFEEFMSFLKHRNVDLSLVQRAPTGEEEGTILRKASSISLHVSKSEPDLSCASKDKNDKTTDDMGSDISKKYSKDTENAQPIISRRSREQQRKIGLLQIPKKEDILQLFMREEQEKQPRQRCRNAYTVESSSSDGYETAEEDVSDSDEVSITKQNLFDEDPEEDYEEDIPKEKIMKRINSHKGMKSYQLADQLSCRWTTGAGPRIGCMRDYPSELQFRVLEEAHLSPRSSLSSPRRSSNLTPKNYRRETLGKSPLAS